MGYEYEFKIASFTGIIYVLALHFITPFQKSLGGFMQKVVISQNRPCLQALE